MLSIDCHPHPLKKSGYPLDHSCISTLTFNLLPPRTFPDRSLPHTHDTYSKVLGYDEYGNGATWDVPLCTRERYYLPRRLFRSFHYVLGRRYSRLERCPPAGALAHSGVPNPRGVVGVWAQ